jgi:hypothetical protein
MNLLFSFQKNTNPHNNKARNGNLLNICLKNKKTSANTLTSFDFYQTSFPKLLTKMLYLIRIVG